MQQNYSYSALSTMTMRTSASLSNPNSRLYHKLGYTYKNPELLKEALTRRSAIEEKVSGAATRDYQRLEFLGDRVLNFFVVRLLLHKELCSNNEELNNLTIRCIANHGQLVEIAQKLELENHLLRGQGEQIVTDKMYADALEALLGSIYCDSGYDDRIVFKVIKRLFFPYLPTAYKREQSEVKIENTIQVTEKETKSYSNLIDLDMNEDYFPLAKLTKKFATSCTTSSHFDEGAYQFKKTVLNWSLTEIQKPLSDIKSMQPLPSQFGNYYLSSNRKRIEYFASFEPLILEEARSILANGLDEYISGKAEQLELRIVKAKKAKNSKNPSIFQMQGKLKKDFEHGSSNIGLLLTPVIDNTSSVAKEDVDAIKLLGLASYQENEQEEKMFEVKVVVPTELLHIFDSIICQRHSTWKGCVLGSVVTQQRMFEVCKRQPQVYFEEQIFAGKLEALPSIQSLQLPSSEEKLLSKLNPSQADAVKYFLAMESGLQVLQGPPGTGKTTTLVTLLEILYERKLRVLVCATSNKGVQVIAKRFVSSRPNDPAILVGVKKKLDPYLEEIFLHTWGENICKSLETNINLLKQLGNEFKEYVDTSPKETTSFTKDQKESKSEVKQTQTTGVINLLASITVDLKSIATRLGKTAPMYDDPKRWKDIFSSLQTIEITQQNTEKAAILNVVVKSLNSLLVKITQANQINTNSSASPLESQILEYCPIIFSTLSSAGRKSIMEMKEVDVLLVDEASQAVEAETVIPFALNPKKCLLIGDTKQLSATVLSQPAADLNYGRSLMWRLIEECKQPCGMLTTQYRMHPEIRAWPSSRYYEDKLTEDKATTAKAISIASKYPKILAPCSFIHVEAKEENKNHSYFNRKEAEYVVAIIRYLKRCGVDLATKVGVITFYAEQVKFITEQLKEGLGYNDVTVQTADGFQGDERDFIIVSFVRANSSSQIGFLRDFKRLNVAITRARYSLIMLGNVTVLQSKKSDVAELLENMHQRDLIWRAEELTKVLADSQDNSSSMSDIVASNSQQLHKLFTPLLLSLHYEFKNLELLQQAMTRNSAVEEKLALATKESGWSFQFLGKHLLNLILAIVVFEKYPNYNEGELHAAENKYIATSNLVTISKKLKLENVLIRGNGEKDMTDQMHIDALRSLLGAIYLETSHSKLLKGIVNTMMSVRTLQSRLPQKIVAEKVSTKSKNLTGKPQNSNLTWTKETSTTLDKTTSATTTTAPNKNNILQPSPNALYKTELCSFFLRGNCRKGKDCQYAHGKDEIRRLPKNISSRNTNIETKSMSRFRQSSPPITVTSQPFQFTNALTSPSSSSSMFFSSAHSSTSSVTLASGTSCDTETCDPDKHQQFINQYLVQQNLQAVIFHYEAMIKLLEATVEPDKKRITTAYHNLACYYHTYANQQKDRGETKSAAKYINKAHQNFLQGLSIIPTPGIRIEYANFLLRQNHLSEAIKELEQLIKMHTPSAKQTPQRFTLNYSQLDRSTLDTTLQAELDYWQKFTLEAIPFAYYLLISAYSRQNNLEAAKKLLPEFSNIAVQEQNSLIYSLCASVQMLVKDYQGAITSYKKALQLTSDYTIAKNQLNTLTTITKPEVTQKSETDSTLNNSTNVLASNSSTSKLGS